MLTIAFDADDTLWHNESLFAVTQAKFRELLAPYGDAAWIDQQLYATETRNLAHFGYGIKGFTLSMIETAVELTAGRIGGRAAHVPYAITWQHEVAAPPARDHNGYFHIESLAALPALVAQL